MVMMRETLASSNDLRDKARDALSPEERMMLLEGEVCYSPTTEHAAM